MEDGTGVDDERSPDDAMNSDAYSIVDDDLEASPVARNRANTWHGPPKVTPKDGVSAGETGPDADFGPDGDGMVALDSAGSSGTWRKGTARRNAWGNLSYADLITKAIESSPEKRMTLSQIYGWMVQNISFFKDKGESNSSAGWKNSIRHNLSLHNRFMRMQNEGTGKSSWWMLNPDAKAVKIPRRRAATMDTKAYTGKRSRVQRAVSMSTATSADLVGKNNERDNPEVSATIFTPAEYQGSTTAGGIGLGSLSHMQPVTEMEDVSEPDFVPSSSSWSSYSSSDNFAETLSESLADIFVGNLIKDNMQSPEFRNRISAPLSGTGNPSSLSPSTFVTPSCPITLSVTLSQGTSCETRDGLSSSLGAFSSNLQTFGSTSFSPGIKSAISLSKLPDATHHFANPIRSTQTADGILQVSSCNIYANNSNEVSKVPDKASKPSSPNDNLYNQFVPELGISQVQPVNSAPLSNPRQLNSQFLLQMLASKPQLMAKMQHLIQTKQQQQFVNSPIQTHTVQSNPVVSNRSSSMLQQLLISSSDPVRCDPLHLHQVPSLPAVAPTLVTSTTSTFIPADLDLNFLDFDASDIDCDIDQVIKHELTFGEHLDFAFDHPTDV